MKYSLSILFAAVLAFGLTPASAAVESWAESYGVGSYGAGGKHLDNPDVGSGSDYPIGIAKMPDGGYVVAGMLDLPERYANYNAGTTSYALSALVRFGPDGSVIWQKALDQSNDTPPAGFYSRANSYVYQIATDAQGNIFIAGGKGNYTNGGQQPFVAKFSSNGALIWDNGIAKTTWKTGDNPATFADSGVGAFTTMALTHDGGVVVGSIEGKPDGTKSLPVVCKFNSDGSLALHAVYDLPLTSIAVSAICQAKNTNNYVFLINHPESGGNYPNPHGMTAIEIDPSGNVVREKSFAPDDGRIETPLQIIATTDGGYATFSQLAKGYSGGTILDAGGFVLRKFDSQLGTTFEKLYLRPGQNNAYYNNQLSQTADGGFLIAGHNSSDLPNDTGFFEASLTRVSPSGAILSVSLLGGPQSEGTVGGFSPGSGTYALQAKDGGYAFTTKTQSYTVDGAIGGGSYYKGDWWILKTDANRKVRSFKDNFRELALSQFTVITKTRPGGSGDVTRISPSIVVGATTTSQPAFILEDLSKAAAPNKPLIAIQGSSPRILGANVAEAVIGQHFSYQVLAGFFDDGKPLTYSATGLPQNFTIDEATGVISGVAAKGTETTNPITVTLHVTDGTDTATATLRLSIGDGVPQFTVNGSDQPAVGLADQPLAFAAVYPGKVAGHVLTVQSSTDGTKWTDLPTGTDGFMFYDINSGRYVLNTTNYPAKSGVRFRVLVTVPGRPDATVVSNQVGPFNLTSSKQRAGQMQFSIVRNGLRSDFDFRATLVSATSGVALRVQSSTTPGDESSWIDISSAQGNAMKADDATNFSLVTNAVTATGDGVYFRAVAAAGGFVDSLSNLAGPFSLIPHTPPTVTIVSPSGGTDQNSAVSYQQSSDGTFVVSISVKATKNDRALTSLGVAFGGNIIHSFENPESGQLYTVSYSTDQLGDHAIEAIAFDDLGATGRAGTPVFIRIVPAAASAMKAEHIGGSSAASATVHRNVFNLAVSGGDWDKSGTWRDLGGNPGIPGASDFVIIGDKSVQLPPAVKVFALSINGGHIIGPGSLTVTNSLTIGGGSFGPDVDLLIDFGCVCELINATDVTVNGSFSNLGTLNVHGARGITGMSNFKDFGKTNFLAPLLPSEQIALGLPLDLRTISANDFTMNGRVSQASLAAKAAPSISLKGTMLISPTVPALVGNSGGTLITNDGGSLITNDGGSLITNDGGSLITNDGGSLITNDGGSIISNDGASAVAKNAAALVTDNGSGFGANAAAFKVDVGHNVSSADARAATLPPAFTINGGEVDLSNIVIVGPVTLNGGVLTGSGVIGGNLTNNGGYISPGHSPGHITVTGNFTQGANGTTIIEAAGGAGAQFDQLRIAGTAHLGGKLDLRLLNGYVPAAGEIFNPIGYKSATGSFTSSSNAQVSVKPTGVSAVINPGKANPGAGQPLNISTRMEVLSGENVLIAGFIVSGPAGSHKKVLIRGLGPSLPVGSAALADPLLEFHSASGSVVTNDDWKSDQQSEIAATTIPPSKEKESAIVATISVGSSGFANCTAVLKGAHGETGIGLVEVYDLDASSPAKLANISTRGFVDTGDNVMIGGFIVGGGEPAKILVRGIGPSLKAAGIAGAIDDPMLELHDSNGAVISNDDWRATQEREVKDTTIPPSSDREPAIVQTLAPGNYTAVLRGKNNTVGVGLVEAYNLQ